MPKNSFTVAGLRGETKAETRAMLLATADGGAQKWCSESSGITPQ
jgi:hypothetical protein